MLKIVQPIIGSDGTVVVHATDIATYTEANARRRQIGAQRSLIDGQPVELELWELVPAAPDDMDTLFQSPPPPNWVYVNTLTTSILQTLTETEDYDDSYLIPE